MPGTTKANTGTRPDTISVNSTGSKANLDVRIQSRIDKFTPSPTGVVYYGKECQTEACYQASDYVRVGLKPFTGYTKIVETGSSNDVFRFYGTATDSEALGDALGSFSESAVPGNRRDHWAVECRCCVFSGGRFAGPGADQLPGEDTDPCAEMKRPVNSTLLVALVALLLSSCATSEKVASSEVVSDDTAAVTTVGSCRFTKPSTRGMEGLEAILKRDFGANYGFDENALMKPAGGKGRTRERGGTFALWLGNAENPKTGVGWSEGQQAVLRRLLRDTGWTPCTLERGAFAEREFEGEWINVQFVEAGRGYVALLFSNYGDEPLPRFKALDAGD